VIEASSAIHVLSRGVRYGREEGGVDRRKRARLKMNSTISHLLGNFQKDLCLSPT
jgi:hypothetical protein